MYGLPSNGGMTLEKVILLLIAKEYLSVAVQQLGNMSCARLDSGRGASASKKLECNTKIEMEPVMGIIGREHNWWDWEKACSLENIQVPRACSRVIVFLVLGSNRRTRVVIHCLPLSFTWYICNPHRSPSQSGCYPGFLHSTCLQKYVLSNYYVSGPVLHSTNARVNEINIVPDLMELTASAVVLNHDCRLLSPAELL